MRLHLQKQQQINGRQNQSSAGFGLPGRTEKHPPLPILHRGRQISYIGFSLYPRDCSPHATPPWQHCSWKCLCHFFSSGFWLSNVSSRLEGVSMHLFVYLICQIICDCDVVEIIFKMKSVCTGILVFSEIATYIWKRPQYFWPCVTIHCYSALSICKKKIKKSASCGNWAHFSVSSSSPSPEVKGKGMLPLTPISNNPKNALWQLPENRCRLLPMKPGSVVRQAVCPLPRTVFCYSHMHKKVKWWLQSLEYFNLRWWVFPWRMYFFFDLKPRLTFAAEASVVWAVNSSECSLHSGIAATICTMMYPFVIISQHFSSAGPQVYACLHNLFAVYKV